MTKYLVLFFSSCIILFTNAQVGINTDTPEATLDVRAENHLGSVSAIDGVLVPRVSDLEASGSQNGQLVYLIANYGAFTKGFHYWSGTEWLPLDTNTQDGDAWGVTGEDQTGTISRSGDVGIGTTNPISKLDVEGNVRIGVIPNGASGDYVLVVGTNGIISELPQSEITGAPQTLSVSGDSLVLSNGGGSVPLPAGPQGEPGPAGADGTNGADGKSAYEIAQDNNFTGTESEWLDSLKGDPGTDGADGTNGADGKSAYEIAQDNNFTGTESEWLDSLKGDTGDTGPQGPAGSDATADGDAWAVSGEDTTSNVFRSGNVGIGTTTAPTSYKLDVNGFTNLSNIEVGKLWGLANWGVINYTGAARFTDYIIARENTGRTLLNTTAGQTIEFRRNNSGIGIFDNNGNFGIGNFGPGTTTAKLDVDGNARFRTIPAGQSTDELLTIDASGYVRKVAQTDIAKDGDAWGVTGEDQTSSVYRSGNISIGTSAVSSYKLNVNGISNLYNIEMGNLWGGSDWAVMNYKGATSTTGYSFARNAAGRTLFNTPDGQTIEFRRSNNIIGLFDNNGNLGVGGFAPGSTTAKLDVAGNGKFTGTVTASGYNTSSDRRLKKNISPITNGLSTVKKLNAVEYDKKQRLASTEYDHHEFGFIAQEIEKVLPQIVHTSNDSDGKEIKTVSYTELIPILTKAIQEQQKQIEALKKEVEELKSRK